MKAIAGSRTSRSYRPLFSWNQGRLLLSANCSRNSKSVGWNLSNFIMGMCSVRQSELCRCRDPHKEFTTGLSALDVNAAGDFRCDVQVIGGRRARGWFVVFVQAVSGARRIVLAPHVIVILNRGRGDELPPTRVLRPWPDELRGLVARRDSVGHLSAG